MNFLSFALALPPKFIVQNWQCFYLENPGEELRNENLLIPVLLK